MKKGKSEEYDICNLDKICQNEIKFACAPSRG
jgi:hypothetical protein